MGIFELCFSVQKGRKERMIRRTLRVSVLNLGVSAPGKSCRESKVWHELGPFSSHRCGESGVWHDLSSCSVMFKMSFPRSRSARLARYRAKPQVCCRGRSSTLPMIRAIPPCAAAMNSLDRNLRCSKSPRELNGRVPCEMFTLLRFARTWRYVGRPALPAWRSSTLGRIGIGRTICRITKPERS